MMSTFETLLNPLDGSKAEVLRAVTGLAGQEHIPLMLFGAFAREVHFYHAYNIEGGRATEDMDLSIQVPDWASYERFAGVLLSCGFKRKHEKHPEKLIHQATELEVDLLPFGEIAEGTEEIIWPTDGSPWSVVGFEDAFASAHILDLAEGKTSPVQLAVVPVPAIVVLKLTAIYDRPEKRFKKDGTDIAFIISNYLDIGNRVRLQQGEDSDIVASVDGDLDCASAVLVGRDIARTISEGTRDHVRELMRHEVESGSRCHVLRGMTGAAFPDFPRAREIMRAMLQGVEQA
jgi:predicted nucleotidyltransferase